MHKHQMLDYIDIKTFAQLNILTEPMNTVE